MDSSENIELMFLISNYSTPQDEEPQTPLNELVISTFEKSLNRIPLKSVDVQLSALPSIRSSPPDIRAIYAQHSRMMRARGGNADGGARWASLALVVIALCELFVGLLRASPRVGLLGASFAAIGFFVGTIGLGWSFLERRGVCAPKSGLWFQLPALLFMLFAFFLILLI